MERRVKITTSKQIISALLGSALLCVYLDSIDFLSGFVLCLEYLGEVPVPQLVQDVEIRWLGAGGYSGGGRQLLVQRLDRQAAETCVGLRTQGTGHRGQDIGQRTDKVQEQFRAQRIASRVICHGRLCYVMLSCVTAVLFE